MDENNLDEEARLKAEQDKIDREKIQSRGSDSPAQFACAAKQITQEELIRDATEVARREPVHELRESARDRQLTEPAPEKEDQGERDRRHRENMESRGYDSDSPVQSAEFQRLQDKVENKQITEWELGREMNKVAYLERDNGIQEAAREKLNEQSLGNQDQAEQGQRDREEMESRGYHSDSPEQVAEFQRLQDKVENKQITEWELGRGMNKAAYLERDNGLREAARERQLSEPPGPDINKDREPKGLTHSIEQDEKPIRPGIGLEVPTPYRQQPQQRPHETEEREPEQKPFLKRVMDWERMLTDPAYRKEMEQQAKEERAFRLQQMGQERGGGPQRTGGRGR